MFGASFKGTLGPIRVEADLANFGAEGTATASPRGVTPSAGGSATLLGIKAGAGSRELSVSALSCTSGDGCHAANAGFNHVDVSSNLDVGAGATLGVVHVGATLHTQEAITAIRGMAHFLKQSALDWLRGTFTLPDNK